MTCVASWEEGRVCVHRLLSKHETVESIEGLAYKNKKRKTRGSHESVSLTR